MDGGSEPVGRSREKEQRWWDSRLSRSDLMVTRCCERISKRKERREREREGGMEWKRTNPPHGQFHDGSWSRQGILKVLRGGVWQWIQRAALLFKSLISSSLLSFPQDSHSDICDIHKGLFLWTPSLCTFWGLSQFKVLRWTHVGWRRHVQLCKDKHLERSAEEDKPKQDLPN